MLALKHALKIYCRVWVNHAQQKEKISKYTLLLEHAWMGLVFLWCTVKAIVHVPEVITQATFIKHPSILRKTICSKKGQNKLSLAILGLTFEIV